MGYCGLAHESRLVWFDCAEVGSDRGWIQSAEDRLTIVISLPESL